MRFGIFSVGDHYPELPRTQSELYNELIRLACEADVAGFDSFWVAEHHFHHYGSIPRPAILLSAIAQRTKRLRLGPAVAVLPFDNPLRLAEDYALLDALSDGRVNLAVGSGYLSHEYEGFGVDRDERRERFDEALAVVRKAWTGKAFSYHGKHQRFDNVVLNVVPTQDPHPPISIAVLRNDAAPFVGAKGMGMMMIPYAASESVDELAVAVTAYKQALNGSAGGGNRVLFAMHVVCAPTTEEARVAAAAPMETYVSSRLFARRRSLDELMERNLAAVGDPAEIVRVVKLYEQAGFTDFLAILNFGGMAYESSLRTLKLLASEVMPHFSN